MRHSVLGCFQTLTSTAGAADDFDLLVELRNLNFINIVLDMLGWCRENPNMLGALLTILTNISLNDQNNVRIRLHGAHIIGALLMENCSTFSKPKAYVRLLLI